MPEEKKTEAVPPTQNPEIVSPEKAPTVRIPTDDDHRTEGEALTPFEGDFMEVTVRVAEELAKYEKAIDTILNFIIRRTYPGDWVSHDKDSTPLEERTANMIGAAAERIARDLGIQESDRTQPERIMDETRQGHYYYECRGKFSFRGRTVEAIGRASTANPFHLAKADGNVAKIRDEYLIQEAWRDCTKQGIKGLFGLRKIPITKLASLGYDISKIKYVTFKSKEGGQSQKNPSATAKPEGADGLQHVSVLLESITHRTWGNKDVTDIVDAEGVKYGWWGKNANDETIKAMVVAKDAGKQIVIHYKVKDGKYNNIDSVEVPA